MQLAAIESSKIIYLTQLYRPTGQLYLPEAAAALAQRYLFTKYPSLEDLSKNVQTFGIGKFENSQIQEMSIYNDGVIVSAMSNTKVLDAFLVDVLSWAESNFGLTQAVIAKPEKHYESMIIVKANLDLIKITAPKRGVTEAFNKAWKNRHFGNVFISSSFTLDCDRAAFSGKRKPIHFGIERRIGLPFDENVFHSTAPLTTDDHLELLERLEFLAADS